MKRMFNKNATPKGGSNKKEETTTPSAADPPNTVSVSDDATLHRSGNPNKKSRSKQQMSLEQQLAAAKEQIAQEKAGKRKLFHSLVKLANELRRTRNESGPIVQRQRYEERTWYEGGMWRAPQVLPALGLKDDNAPTDDNDVTVTQRGTVIQQRRPTIRQAISLSDLFFSLVIVTAFTRVGVAISESSIRISSFCYFLIFWSVWNKETSYSTRFDTTDLSAQVTTLCTCFAVLFASLSVQSPMNSEDANRIMIMAAAVAVLHAALHARVLMTTTITSIRLARHVRNFAVFNMVVCTLEAAVWLTGVLAFPVDWEYRWVIFVVALALGLRIPRAFLANDFHAASSKRGVLFILLLGFLLQSIVVVATEFFEYQTPTMEHYSFIGAVCLMLFCIKLMYVDDSDTLAEDHALLVNRWAAFFFMVGQFLLLFSTTIMGSGLNLLTHSYLAATAALPGPEKTLVCGGFSATLFATFFIKSMHVKRVPIDPRNRALFVAAYVVQSVVLLVVVGMTAIMCLGTENIPFLNSLMQTDIQLLFALSGMAFLLVLMGWLDEGIELALYDSPEHSRAYRIHPFGFWWCLKPEVSEDVISNELEESGAEGRKSLSVLSPLLGSSVAASMRELGDSYGAMEQQSSGSLGGEV